MPGPPAPPDVDPQVLVQVTLILSDDTLDQGEGLNLLDGLQLQFGESLNQTNVSGHPTASFERTITGMIALPQVTYSLNLFNRTRSYYWVLSRPTLTAYLGQESDFFVGHTVSVPVAGVNLGSLQSVDAGTSLKVTLLEITAKKVKFKIEANRSFFDPVSQIQGFSQQISVFKESASATAELQFGQTLILSGLSENTTDQNHNVVPGFSQVPVIGELFGRHDIETQKTSVLILVTPLPPVEMDLPQRIERDGEAADVAKFWTTLIDPQSDLRAITADLSRYYGSSGAYGYSRAERSDISLAGPTDKAVIGAVLSAEERPAPGS
jgi:type II secretory pathway component GspD/PulD (secretin)